MLDGCYQWTTRKILLGIILLLNKLPLQDHLDLLERLHQDNPNIKIQIKQVEQEQIIISQVQVVEGVLLLVVVEVPPVAEVVTLDHHAVI